MNWWVIIIESFAHTTEGNAKKVANFSPEIEVRFKSLEERLNQLVKQSKTHQSLIELKADNMELLWLANEKCDKKEMLELIPNIDIKATAT